jgi:iron(III) transport system permease protein
MRGKRFVELCLYGNLAVSPFVLAASWVSLANPNSGLLNLLTKDVIGSEPLNVLTIPGIIFVMITYFTPWFYLTVKPAIAGIDGALEQAASVHGASGFRVFRAISLRVVTPPVIGACVLVFVLSIDMFSIPAVLGVPSGITVLPYQMYSYIYGFPAEWQYSAVVGVFLVAITAILMVVHDKVVGDVRMYRVIGGKGASPRKVRLGRYRWLLSAVSWVYSAIATIIPALGLVLAAFVTYTSGTGLSSEKFTLGNFRDLFANAAFAPAVRVSIVVMLVVALADVILASAVLVIAIRFPVRLKILSRAARFLVRAPVGIPGIARACSGCTCASHGRSTARSCSCSSA